MTSKQAFVQVPLDTPDELRRTLQRMVEEIELLKARVAELEKG